MPTDIKAVAREYISWDTNASTRGSISKLLDANDTAALEKLLGTRLEFGTAGLRGPMAAGYAAMNELKRLRCAARDAVRRDACEAVASAWSRTRPGALPWGSYDKALSVGHANTPSFLTISQVGKRTCNNRGGGRGQCSVD